MHSKQVLQANIFPGASILLNSSLEGIIYIKMVYLCSLSSIQVDIKAYSEE